MRSGVPSGRGLLAGLLAAALFLAAWAVSRSSPPIVAFAQSGETEDPFLWFPVVFNQVSGIPEICFSEERPLLSIQGDQAAAFRSRSSPLPARAGVEARTARWQHVSAYPVIVEGGPDVCFSGGTVIGSYPDSVDWETMHDTTAFTFRSRGRTTVENLRAHNYGDGISFSRGTPADSFHIRRVYLSHMRDDCIQNDYMYSGVIDDSLLDGCYTAISAQSAGASEGLDGSQNLVTVKNSLIRLEPMQQVYQNRGLIPGHGSFFKWNRDDDHSPRLALHNNIFRADQPANNTGGLGIPEGKLASCSNNIMVWLGEGPFPDPLPLMHNGRTCFTITTDPAVWEQAVLDWLVRHPQTASQAPRPQMKTSQPEP
ncbi:MAG TPA: hypothetical protein GYA06_02520 [Chloroflexi bacterium]|nr:hypothetical protein [Chloroflexota bacterium]HPO58761.1 hypothetical protein [Anaerolineaceae bacterium]